MKNHVSNTNSIRKRTQRTHALENDIIQDMYGKSLSAKEKRILARVAHAREKRLKTIAYCRKHGMKPLAKKRRLDNRSFTVCQKRNLDTDTRNKSTINDTDNGTWLETHFKDMYRGNSKPVHGTEHIETVSNGIVCRINGKTHTQDHRGKVHYSGKHTRTIQIVSSSDKD